MFVDINRNNWVRTYYFCCFYKVNAEAASAHYHYTLPCVHIRFNVDSPERGRERAAQESAQVVRRIVRHWRDAVLGDDRVLAKGRHLATLHLFAIKNVLWEVRLNAI